MSRFFPLILAFTLCDARATFFTIPDITIEAFWPRGFRVIMPHKEGIHLFGFHGSLNEKLNNYDAGEFNREISRPTGGAWIYENRDAEIRIGDVMYYWVFVLHDRLGYRKDEQRFEVKEYARQQPINNRTVVMEHKDFNEVPEEKWEQPITPVSVPKRPDSQTPDSKTNLQLCEHTVVKLTQKLLKLEADLEAAKKYKEVLSTHIDKLPDGKKLTMRGRGLSNKDDPSMVAEFILYQKLDLRYNVESAVRNKDESITFELATVNELLSVLREAEDKLKNSSSVTIGY